MDLWFVAAATGAGYLAKYWQKLQSKEGCFELESCINNRQLGSSNSVQHIRNQTNPIDRSSSIDTGTDFLLGRREYTEPGAGSTSYLSDDRIDCNNVLSFTSLLPGLQGKESLQDGSSSKIHMSTRSKYQKCRSRGYLVKPMNFLEGCLAAQLYKEDAKMDDYNSIQSPSTSAARPFLVTDGKRIISRASQDFGGEMQLEVNEMHIGALWRLSGIGSLELLRRPRRNSVQRGSRNEIHFLLLGITIGIISATIITNKRETGEPKEVLKKSQKLAHDFHEELEMKDLMTMEELIHKDSESTGRSRIFFSNGEQVSFSDEQNSYGELYDQNLEKYESISKIEAELEAELERLELNINTSSSENVFEMDPGIASDIIYRVPTLRNDGSDSNRDSMTPGNQTPDAYYAVSPWELSLRLHEVIQSRLEARIAELERALKNSQKQVRLLESEHTLFPRNEYTEGKSSTQGSPPLTEEDERNADQPLFLNLSGEALAAYNEVYDEIWNITANNEEESRITMHCDDNLNVLQGGDKMLFQGRISRPHGTISKLDISEERWFKNSLPDKNISYECTSKSWVGESEDEEDNDDDETGQLLIKQIVAKARQGSSAVLNVQRMLNSMQEQQ